MKRIISASYKEDLPAFHSELFFQNLERGYCDLPSKFGMRRISLLPKDVYCIVFWTKNINISDHFYMHMQKIKSPWYIQWTITGYEKDIEPNVPAKHIVMRNFKCVSSRIGARRTIWRYDPIFISDKYTVDYHKQMFRHMCQELKGHTERCVISFMDEYGKISDLVRAGVMRAPTKDEVEELSAFIGKTAAEHGIRVQTCAEGDYDLTRFGIHEGPCIDAEFIEKEFNVSLPAAVKSPGSFRRCLCAVNTDIGNYHTCRHDCAYCYAK